MSETVNDIRAEHDPLTALRQVSRTVHERVDQAYSRFNLSDPTSYGAFLQAHAKVLPIVEQWLATQHGLPSWQGRTDLLRRDLQALGQALPKASYWQPA